MEFPKENRKMRRDCSWENSMRFWDLPNMKRKNQQFSKRLAVLSGYCITTVPLLFSDTLLIHAQRPGVTACAELEVWNHKMKRWVNRGAKGIALIDDRYPKKDCDMYLMFPIHTRCRVEKHRIYGS